MVSLIKTNPQVFFQRKDAETGNGRSLGSPITETILARRELSPKLMEIIKDAWEAKDNNAIVRAIALVFANLAKNEAHLAGTSQHDIRTSGSQTTGAILVGFLTGMGGKHYYCEYLIEKSILHTLSGNIDGAEFKSGPLQSAQDAISAIEKHVLNFGRPGLMQNPPSATICKTLPGKLEEQFVIPVAKELAEMMVCDLRAIVRESEMGVKNTSLPLAFFTPLTSAFSNVAKESGKFSDIFSSLGLESKVSEIAFFSKDTTSKLLTTIAMPYFAFNKEGIFVEFSLEADGKSLGAVQGRLVDANGEPVTAANIEEKRSGGSIKVEPPSLDGLQNLLRAGAWHILNFEVPVLPAPVLEAKEAIEKTPRGCFDILHENVRKLEAAFEQQAEQNPNCKFNIRTEFFSQGENSEVILEIVPLLQPAAKETDRAANETYKFGFIHVGEVCASTLVAHQGSGAGSHTLPLSGERAVLLWLASTVERLTIFDPKNKSANFVHPNGVPTDI